MEKRGLCHHTRDRARPWLEGPKLAPERRDGGEITVEWLERDHNAGCWEAETTAEGKPLLPQVDHSPVHCGLTSDLSSFRFIRGSNLCPMYCGSTSDFSTGVQPLSL